jgi:hypothetical protein
MSLLYSRKPNLISAPTGLLCVAFALSVRMWAEYESYCRPLALGLTFTLQVGPSSASLT